MQCSARILILLCCTVVGVQAQSISTCAMDNCAILACMFAVEVAEGRGASLSESTRCWRWRCVVCACRARVVAFSNVQRHDNSTLFIRVWRRTLMHLRKHSHARPRQPNSTPVSVLCPRHL